MSVPTVLPPSPPTTLSRKQRSAQLPSFVLPTSTPDDSPASAPPSSQGSRKRVNFSPWTNVHASTESVTSTNNPQIRPLPPSRQCSTSNKSILKVNGQELRIAATHDGAVEDKQSLSDAMDSIVHQLTRNDTIECVDAYQTLAAAVKAYDDLPDLAILRAKLHLITKAIKQHLCIIDHPEPKPAEINLVTSALKVLVILVWNSDFSPLLTDDFRLFALDKAISAVLEHRAPKSVIVHYLHFLATQDFRPTLMTTSRAMRLIEALSTLSEHIKGNGIISERLLVYSRLLNQSRAVMKGRVGLWAEHMLSAMVSSIPDTRSKALALGRRSCQCFPSASSISLTIRAILKDEQDDGKTKGAAMCKKLEKMVLSKDFDQAEHVPQIWAVVILLCNSSSTSVDGWAGLVDWLMVIQRCLNSSDSNLRAQANMAWNRFVFVARPQEASDQLLSMLVKPILSQLDRSSTDKRNKTSHATAVSSYCNLLYYAFRPATSVIRLTKAWNEYIVKVMRSSFFQKNPANADIACRILMALFWNVKPGQKVWNENRAHENRLCEPEELPTIDCKWVRSKAGPICDLFAVLFKYSSWGFAASVEQAYVSKAWRSFIKSVRSAGAKEIKMSTEARSSTLAILNVLQTLHIPTVGAVRDSEDMALPRNVVLNIVHIAISELHVGYIVDALEHESSSVSASNLEFILNELPSRVRTTTTSINKQECDTAWRFLELCDSFFLRSYNREDDAEKHASLELLPRIVSFTLALDAEGGLLRLQNALKVWVIDELDALKSPLLERIAELLTRALCRVPPASVPKLDAVFAAAFASTHRTMVSQMAKAWNDVFGESEDLELGPELVRSLQRLRPYVELRMPAGCMESWTELRDSVTSYNTQDPDSVQLSVGPDVEAHVGGEAEGKESAENDCRAPDELPQQAVPEVVPSATDRRRHDDSQIDFVPVQSSPDAAVESQYLTERQREVRDRQRTEPAVVFADIRSSPRPASRAPSESRDCGFARKAASLGQRPSTPPLPDQMDDIEIQSSPTPKTRYLRNVADVEIPSSPPSMQGNAERSLAIDHLETSPAPEAEPLENSQSTSPNINATEEEPATSDAEHEPEVDLGIRRSQRNQSPAIATQADEDHEQPERCVEDSQGPSRPLQQPSERTSQSDYVSGLGNPFKQQPAMGAPRPATNLFIVENVATGSQFLEEPQSRRPVNMPTATIDYSLQVDRPAIQHAVNTNPLPIQTSAPMTPKRASSRIDSDELDLMTHSQLSNDLEMSWSGVFEKFVHVAAEVEDQQHQEQESEILSVKPAITSSQSKSAGRKRKAASALWSRGKKTKRASHSSSQRAESQESFIKMEDERGDDLYEMIEVLPRYDTPIPSSPPHVDADGDMFVDAPESQVSAPPKKRGRPRKTRRLQHKAASKPASELFSSSQRSRRSIYSNERSPEPQEHLSEPEPPSEVVELSEDEQMAVDSTNVESGDQPVASSREPRQDAVELKHSTIKDATTTLEKAVQTPMSIVALLQQTLDQIKNAEPGSVDLRKVDELCFQIRFQAQLKTVSQSNTKETS